MFELLDIEDGDTEKRRQTVRDACRMCTEQLGVWEDYPYPPKIQRGEDEQSEWIQAWNNARELWSQFTDQEYPALHEIQAPIPACVVGKSWEQNLKEWAEAAFRNGEIHPFADSERERRALTKGDKWHRIGFWSVAILLISLFVGSATDLAVEALRAGNVTDPVWRVMGGGATGAGSLLAFVAGRKVGRLGGISPEVWWTLIGVCCTVIVSAAANVW